ncbi:MAG: transcription antitermination factor NusB [Deltaproteobacteria bacterium]
MASRRKSREFALQMLFQWEVGDHRPEHVLSTFFAGRNDDPEVERFARSLFEGTLDELATIDQLIREQSQNWRVERMSAVDRNLLRLSIFELLRQTETPPAVVIDEALEIARKFSGESSVEFVNGILDGVRKKLSSNGPPAEPTQTQSAKTSPQK